MVNQYYPLRIQHLTKKSRPTPFLRIATRLHSRTLQSSYTILFEISGDEIFTSDLDSISSEIGCAAEIKFGNLE